MNKKIRVLLAMVMGLSMGIFATGCDAVLDAIRNPDPNDSTLNVIVPEYEGPKAKIERATEEELAAYNATGIIEETTAAPVTLETAYTFSIEGNAEDYADSEYLTWNADYFVSFDKAIVENTVCLAGSYDAWLEGRWVAFWIPEAMEAGQQIQLLASAGVTINCEELYTIVQEFRCGVMNVAEDKEGTKMTVELRLTNPEDETDFLVVSVTEYVF